VIRRKQSGQQGGSRLRVVVTLVFIATVIFVAVELVPPYFAYYQFQDAIKTEVRFALTGYPKKSADDIRDDIYQKAQELDIPATKDGIQLNMDPTNGRVDIGVDYSVPIDLKVYQFTLQFHPHADNHTI
jgi:anionic cell wall polymer biosynthesis LytR-Cps2A-Psr (LCP) family protein